MPYKGLTNESDPFLNTKPASDSSWGDGGMSWFSVLERQNMWCCFFSVFVQSVGEIGLTKGAETASFICRYVASYQIQPLACPHHFRIVLEIQSREQPTGL